MEQHAYVVVIRGADPVRLRTFIETQGWQMPLAPFIADETQVALVGLVAKAGRGAK